MFLCPATGGVILFYLLFLGVIYIGLPVLIIFLVVKALVRKSALPYKLP